MKYDDYLKNLEDLNKELKKFNGLANESRIQYLEMCQEIKNKLLTFENENKYDTEFIYTTKLGLRVAETNLKMLEQQESALFNEKQNSTAIYQVISNRESSRRQRELTGAIIFIGLVSLFIAITNY